MATNRLVIWIGIIALIGLGVWFYAMGNPSNPPESQSTADSTATTGTVNAPADNPTRATAPKPNTGNTYKSLLTQQGSYQCDYNQVQTAGQSTGVIYLYGGKMRAEFRTVSGTVTTANITLYDGHYLYEWHEGTSRGSRSVLTALSQLPLAIPQDLTNGKIYGSSYESVGWNCHQWLTNTAILNPPSYVQFTSI